MKPKFKIDEAVKFDIGGIPRKGTVNIIDRTMGRHEYDVLVLEENVLYKHLPESSLEKLT